MARFKNFYINKKNTGLLKILGGAVVFLLLLFILNSFVSPIKNLFYAVSYPIQKTFWTAGISSTSFFGSVWSSGSLSKENDNLKNENQKLLAQVATLQSIAQANKAQSDVSESCQDTEFILLMVGVVGLDANDMLSINKGSSDGITEGMPVINQQKVIFGRVYRVYKNFSQVMLISNKDSVINVQVQLPATFAEDSDEPKEIDGIVRGKGGLSAYLDLIPISSDIKDSDVLITSSIENSFPKDLLVGTIMNIQKDDQKSFQESSVNLFMDLKTADNLFVITNYKN